MDRKMALLAVLSGLMAATAGCGKPGKTIDLPEQRKRYGMILDGGFEYGEGWYRTAPPGYSQYATITRDRTAPKSGRFSAYVALRRHPSGGGEILHGYAQKIKPAPAGRWLLFGGWVRLQGRPTLRFGVEYEVTKPKNGRTFFTVELPPPPSDGQFYYVERKILLPADAFNLVFYVGISSLGRAWFDDVFLRTLR